MQRRAESPLLLIALEERNSRPDEQIKQKRSHGGSGELTAELGLDASDSNSLCGQGTSWSWTSRKGISGKQEENSSGRTRVRC